MRSIGSRLAAGACLGALASAGLAQAEEPGDLTEVVVTAERREQPVQRIPAAVTALTAEHRELFGVAGIQEVSNLAPGMNYSGSDRISIRGAGRNTFYIGNDPGVAAYTDGFYSASSSELYKSSLFVERTEILRGPQGVLYGRNALGGAVHTLSRRPADAFGGELRLLVGDYDRTRVEAAVSLPVAEHLRFKLGGSQDRQRRGFIRNLGAGNEQAAVERTYFEIQAEAELGERTRAWLRYDRMGWDDTFGVGERLYNLITPYNTTEPIGPIGQLTPNPQYGYATPNPGVGDPYLQNTNRPGYAALRGNHVVVGHLVHDLGFAELKYVAGLQRYNFQTGGDYDFTDRTGPIRIPGMVAAFYPDLTTDFDEHKRYTSHELTLTSSSETRLEWMLGLYRYDERHRQRIQLASPQQAELASPLTLQGAPAAPNPARNFADAQAVLDSSAWAVFGHARVRLSPQWAVSGGLRYTRDDKRGFEQQRLVAITPAIAGGAVAVDVSTDLDRAAPGVQNFRTLSDRWDAVAGSAALEWTPRPEVLAYARYDRGYKSGGFLLGTLAPQPAADQETVDAYELGLKAALPGRLSVAAAAFHNDFRGLQLNLQQLNAALAAPANNFVNVDARASGLEVELAWRPLPRLQLAASYALLRTKIVRGCCFYDPADPGALDPAASPRGGSAVSNGTLLVFQDLAGARLYQAPEHKLALGAAYAFDFAPGSLTLATGYVWTDETAYQPFKSRDLKVPAYGVADLSARWVDAQDRFAVVGAIKNLFDELGYNSTGSTAPVAIFERPNAGLQSGGRTYLRQTRTALTRGLIAPRTVTVEIQLRF